MKKLSLIGAAVAAFSVSAFSIPASAGSSFGVGVNINSGPGYYAQPVYYQPRPVYYAPRFYHPYPAYYGYWDHGRYYEPRGYYPGWRGHGHKHGHHRGWR